MLTPRARLMSFLSKARRMQMRFAAFLKCCPDDYDHMVNLVEQKALQLPTEPTSSDGPLTLLSVGAGTGALDEMLLRGPLRAITHYVAMEPIEAHIQQLSERFRRLQVERHAEGQRFEFEHRLTGWTPEVAQGMKADIVLFSHCLYHLPKPEKALHVAATEVLRGEGAVVLAFLCSDASLSELWRTFRHRWRALPSSVMADHGLNCTSVASELQRLIKSNPEFSVEISETANALDFREAVADPAVGLQVLSFLMSQDVGRLPAPLAKELQDSFLEHCQPEGWFPHGNGLITVSRVAR